MSTLEGSVIIDKIQIINLKYLTGSSKGEINSNNWSATDWSNTGLPTYNIEYTKIPEKTFLNLLKALPEKREQKTIFDDYTDLTLQETMHDLYITKTDTDIYITFIDSGAGYQNALGYYFYTIINGEKKILTNSENNNGLTYYAPTIIFPNSSRKHYGESKSHGPLISGIKRKLKGNQSNGSFNDINVGFFLVPDGWKGIDKGVDNEDKNILHSTKEFNSKYNSASNSIFFNGIQSILFKNEGEVFLCFQDIERSDDEKNSGDGAFKNIIIKIETTIDLDKTKYIQMLTDSVPSNMIKGDYYGSFIDQPYNLFKNLLNYNKKCSLVKNLSFNTKQNKDDYIERMKYLSFNLSYKFNNVNNDTDVEIEHEIQKSDVENNMDGDKVKLYIVKKEDNKDDETIVDNVYQKTVYDNLVALQHHEVDNINNSSFKINERDLNNLNESTIINEPNTRACNLTRSSLAWGDPHITMLDGRSVMLPNKDECYNLLTSITLKINIDCRLFTDHVDPIYRTTAFIKYVSFYYKDECVTIDMFNNLDVELKDNKYIKISEINEISKKCNEPKFKSMQSEDTNIKIRICTINNVDIWCIIYSNKPEYYNEVYIDKRDINSLININGLVVDENYNNYIIC
jgi:hypothetical protein